MVSVIYQSAFNTFFAYNFMNSIGLHNLKIEGFDPFQFSVFGVIVVFCGLALIALYIILLPELLKLPSKLRKKRSPVTESSAAVSAEQKNSEKRVLLAIAVAFHMDQDFPEDDQKITWISHGDVGSAWQATGIAHGLSVRNHVHISRRRY